MTETRRQNDARFAPALLCSVILATAGCAVRTPVDECAAELEDATINVAGVFRYAGNGANQETGTGFSLTGTITFEQQGQSVRVTDTSYDFSGLRGLESEFGDMVGNVLVLTLSPINGDTDYRADVKFVFSEDGNEFCVGFDDTNNDGGALGSFSGVRQTQRLAIDRQRAVHTVYLEN